MKKTKIDWADSTWNPVTGCLHGCEYCYARRIAERFKGGCEFVAHGTPEPLTWVVDDPGKRENGQKAVYPFGFDPTFHRYRLDEPKKWKESKNIFVCSMADLFGEWVPEEWIREIFKACEEAPQHRYLFLTKNPARMQRMNSAAFIQCYNSEHPEKPHPETANFSKVTPMPDHDNWWWGSSVTDKNGRYFQGGFEHVFLSIEPLMEPLDAGLGSFGTAEWIIIGAETGNRKGKVIPKKEWVMNIVEAAGITSAAVFMKESLRGIMGNDFKQEFPW